MALVNLSVSFSPYFNMPWGLMVLPFRCVGMLEDQNKLLNDVSLFNISDRNIVDMPGLVIPKFVSVSFLS